MIEEYEKALEQLNIEFKKIYNSNEYRLGKKILKFKYYFKHFMVKKLLNKIINSKKNRIVSQMDNKKNAELFKNNDKNIIKKYSKNDKIVIYTINIGGYDKLLQPLIINKNIDYYYLSDKKPDFLGAWKYIDIKPYIEKLDVNKTRKSRYLKINPHLIFPNYKYSIYIDSNIRIIDDISCFISNINKKTKIAIHPHPYRDCIYKELKCLKIKGKGNYKEMKQQCDEYKNNGMPKEFGLFENNIIIREHNDPKCINIMEQWWNELNTKSERDQLSFTYVLWKNNYTANDIGVICDSIKNNNKVHVIDHIEDYEK